MLRRARNVAVPPDTINVIFARSGPAADWGARTRIGPRDDSRPDYRTTRPGARLEQLHLRRYRPRRLGHGQICEPSASVSSSPLFPLRSTPGQSVHPARDGTTGHGGQPTRRSPTGPGDGIRHGMRCITVNRFPARLNAAEKRGAAGGRREQPGRRARSGTTLAGCC